LKIVLCHNYYRQRGGEDQVFEDEVNLLREDGHQVVTFIRRNDDINAVNLPQTAVETIWNQRAANEIRRIVNSERADVVHFHNWLPLISPSAYWGAKRGGAAVVQTLHNYRFLCPKGTMFRGGDICEKCLGRKYPWPAIQHACYRGSRFGSTVVASTLAIHRAIGTLQKVVDVFIAASGFTKSKYVEAGFDAERIRTKPNFLHPDPGVGSGRGDFVLYFGRLSPEKGIATLLKAWELLESPIPLKISGSGPMADEVNATANRIAGIEFLGFASDSVIDELLREARFLVCPSANYEGFPKTIVESLARGTPIVAGRLGALSELITNGQNGRLFFPGDPLDLANTVTDLYKNASSLQAMRVAARRDFEDFYQAERNCDQLIDIYKQAISQKGPNPKRGT
jgi:glycosyltransferase involved in cell wall biosynthesis